MSAAVDAPALGPGLERLDPIPLDELIAHAALQTRVDRKYLLPLDAVRDLLERLPPDTRVLEVEGARNFAYRSLYFDTPELLSYLLTARRRRRRFKIRTRLYEHSQECWLEVKTRGPRGHTVKHRLPYDAEHHTSLTPGRPFVDTVLTEHRVTGGAHLAFAPTLTTRYRRTTLFLPGTHSRVTIDTDLAWEDGTRQLLLPRRVVVETKTGSTASPVDRLLWQDRYRPVRISKYATGLAALRPHLPATPWRRTLRRDFSADGAARAGAPTAGYAHRSAPPAD